MNGPMTQTSSSSVMRHWLSIGACRRKARKLQRRIQLAGELARGALNSDVFALYEPPAPPVSPTTLIDGRPAAPGHRGR